ncbi:MAG: ABC transporter ATP-binding protein [Aquabacterium sp.]|uniref:ABC transporter ATP-binding protein n=1 Tax=Aquabacterium sp. TaxID=1872578 RepID=UPI0025BA01F7|nr:ABC transporter ATP-binding protein [Aquabacterium sp.]MBI5925825.1 ABC transporter ATP-binding protein [Aquabacterium sp.]
MNGSDLAIDVRGLTKDFGGRTVVDGIDIQVRRGEICGFLGPNGSGKTTTIRMLCGLLEPCAGEGHCLGFDLLTQSRQIKLRTGYMTQKFGLYEDLSIEENLRFIAEVYDMPKGRELVRQTLDKLGLYERRQQLAGSLSGGWKQRLALAACLLHEPELLLLDEPTAGVDPKARRDFWHQIHLLAAEGLTVLVSTHYMDEAERCHRLAYISYGKLLTSGTTQEVIAGSKLKTWEVTGPAHNPQLDRIIALTEKHKDWMAVPFGTEIHVSSVTGRDFGGWLSSIEPHHPWQVRAIPTGLEDVFIHLSQHAQDNFR